MADECRRTGPVFPRFTCRRAMSEHCMSDPRQTARLAGTMLAGSRLRERPACGALRRECVPQAAHDHP